MFDKASSVTIKQRDNCDMQPFVAAELLTLIAALRWAVDFLLSNCSKTVGRIAAGDPVLVCLDIKLIQKLETYLLSRAQRFCVELIARDFPDSCPR